MTAFVIALTYVVEAVGFVLLFVALAILVRSGPEQ